MESTAENERAKPLPPEVIDLRVRIGLAPVARRRDLYNALRRVETLARDGRAFDHSLNRLRDRIEATIAKRERRLALLPKPTFDADLPVIEKRADIAEAISKNQVVIVCGETGSGKTTQLPKICLALGRGVDGMIGHTQPRRIAARAVANRIAFELNAVVGKEVGFKVRFTDQVSEETFVKVMTDGILLAEIQSDRLLEKYDTIIIDEAHERSLNIDFLLGYFKTLLPKRPDLKLIVTSATIDPDRFSKHFENAPIVMVSGRTYPVETRYRPLRSEEEDDREFELPEAILGAVRELWNEAPGDTLIFQTGERDIRETAEFLRRANLPGAEILPLYARLSGEEQMRVFKSHQKRRIVLATNVAETSLTVPGIRYVIDPGLARVSRYSARSKLQRLPVEHISRASADQRKGRCGRVSAGVCIRLYAQDDFEARPEFTDPEILRTNLSSVILQMKGLSLGTLEEFPFIEPPDYRQIRDAYQNLFELGAVDEANELTQTGKLLARLPVDPRIGRMVLAAHDEDCVEEVLVIAAALSVQDPRERPMDKQQQADAAHARFRAGGSDFLTFVNLWRFYHDSLRTLSASKLRKACRENYLSFVRLREWADVQRQLREMSAQSKDEVGRMKDEKRSRSSFNLPRSSVGAHPDSIHRALLAGLLSSIGVKGETFEYAGTRGRRFHLFPGSALFSRKPQWVMAAEIVETTRVYARTVAPIQSEWVERLAEHIVKRTYAEPHWQRKTARVVASEKVMLFGLAIIPRRTIHYGQIDPKTSREIFINSALVDFDYDTNAHFFRHNRDLLREMELIEAKERRRDLLADSKSRFAFYDARIPADVVGGQSFERWRRHAEEADKRKLFMTRDDLLLNPDSAHAAASQFPATVLISGVELTLDYRFDPGHALDGVTMTVPLSALNLIREDRLAWLVPGMLPDKIAELIGLLPKNLRVNLVPAPDVAARAAAAIPFAQGSLYDALAVELSKVGMQPILPGTFDGEAVPNYLKMNVRVIDEAGKELASGRDFRAIRHSLRDRIRDNFAQLPASPWVRDEVAKWDFGDLPDVVELKHNGVTFRGFPAVVDKGNFAALRLLDSPEAAREATHRGVRRLFMIDYRKELSFQIEQLEKFDEMALHYARLGTGGQLKNLLAAAISDRVMFDVTSDVRTKMEFELQLRGAWNRLRPATIEVAEQTRQTLAAYHAVSVALSQSFAPMLAVSLKDMREQFAFLVPKDFLTVTPPNWLPHLPRFVRGIESRLKKLLNAGLTRDSNSLGQVAPFWHGYKERAASKDFPASHIEDLSRFRWLIEELRVSLFAQELKTSVPVSVPRLEKLLIELPGIER